MSKPDRESSKTRKIAPKNAVASLGSSLRPLLPLLVIILLIAGAVYGLEQVRYRVLAQPEFHPVVRVELADPPDWLVREQWTPHIVAGFQPGVSRLADDGQLVGNVAELLKSSGWVQKVHRVTRGMDGTVRVSCDYRRPIAMLCTKLNGKEVYIPVDREGYRLPETFEHLEPDSGWSGWLRLIGVRTPVPRENAQFEGEDARAAIQLATMISDRGGIVASRISAIDVSNLLHPRDRRKSPIVLWRADSLYRIRWGSPIGREIEEPTAEEKLTSIALMLRGGGPQAEVDVSTYADAVIVPAAGASAASAGVQTADRGRPQDR
ncbi:MAG: hypothetical protein KA354_03190 [Phycisphaerae bacterium]|nr:hypothetical protein [Phycisphaerae bacterium]